MLLNIQRLNHHRNLLLSRINYHRRSEFTERISHRLSDIRCQIDTVQSNPEGLEVHTDDILSKVEQTKQTSESLVDIAHTNEQNAISIQQIMERFSISR